MNYSYKKCPKSKIKYKLYQQSIKKWEIIGRTSEKLQTKKFFPNITDIINKSFTLTFPLTGHGPTKQYLHRFHLTASPFCSCDSTITNTINISCSTILCLQEIELASSDVLCTGQCWPMSERKFMEVENIPYLIKLIIVLLNTLSRACRNSI